MGQRAVKISGEEYAALREAAAVNSRSIVGQAEHWLRIGRAVERDPSIAYSRIEQALHGLLSVDALDDDEQEAFFDAFSDFMAGPGASEEKFWEDRRNRGLGAGDDDDSRVFADVSR